jgi:hypothetical protein
VWLCAADLQLIRADRVVSLLVPVGPGFGAVSPADVEFQGAVYAEVEGGTHGDVSTRVKLAECGKSPAAELLAGLAAELGSAAATEGRLFVLAERNAAGQVRWMSASTLPAAWPQSSASGEVPAALTSSPLA